MDPFAILPQEKSRYLDQFNSLKPIAGFVSGDQAKGFLLQSQLPPLILGQIWELADMNSDGKLDLAEFSIACKLITLKLRGLITEIPKAIPQTLKSSASASGTPPMMNMPVSMMGPPLIPIGGGPAAPMPAMPASANIPAAYQAPVPLVQPMVLPTVPVQPAIANIPSRLSGVIPTSTSITTPPGMNSVTAVLPTMTLSGMDASRPTAVEAVRPMSRTASVSSKDSPSGEWMVPQASKQKYAQVFNSHDRAKSGFITGVQARGILVQSQLPQAALAKIWGLSDIDADGRLSCEEFILAMHLCDMARVGDKIPDSLPAELVPPLFRRPSLVATTPANIVGSVPLQHVGDPLAGVATSPPPGQEEKPMSPVSFEDKRKENFDKGQAELDKRRRALAEQQRREHEERERKEREEQERKEKIRQEQERRRLAELEKQLAKQRELEMEKEEQRRKMLEQREAARKEMERQRQLEWQKRRMQELLAQKQKEQEKLALLRINNQGLDAELMGLEDKVMDLSARIVETRTGVAEAKSIIDGMRTTRDTHMSQLTALKTQLRDQNQRLLSVSQEKARLEAKNRINAVTSPSAADLSVAQNLAARQMALNETKVVLQSLQEELAKKTQDAENNNCQLSSLKTELSSLARLCQQGHESYLSKRQKVLQLRATGGKQNVWSSQDSWSDPAASGWPVNTSIVATSHPAASSFGDGGAQAAGTTRYRALYEFVARNGDEISFQPGDIIMVTESVSSEPGWLSGQVRGHVGWFPEAYVEKMDQGWPESAAVGTSNAESVLGSKRHPLEGIQELPENVSDNGSIAETAVVHERSAFIQVSKGDDEPASPILGQGEIVENVEAEALYAWEGKKENHLSFSRGDIILVREQQDIWWFGELNGLSGWFPKSYASVIERRASPVSPRAAQTIPAVRVEEDGYYVAMYPYDSNEPGDLLFSVGEMICVTKKDGDWWTGVIGSRTGVFPSNYVQKAELEYEASMDSEVEAATAAAVAAADYSSNVTAVESADLNLGNVVAGRPNTAPINSEFESSAMSVPRAASSASSGAASPSNAQLRGGKKPEIATVIAPYTATSGEQLSLQRGQLIMIRKKSSSGWWEGELQAKGRKRQIGWFPASYVKVLSSTGSSRNTPAPMDSADDEPMMLPTAPTSVQITAAVEAQESSTDQVVALFPYTAQNDDELSFLQGDVVHVIDREDPAWWKGELRGQTGLFPSNYVEVMGSLAASAALGAAASSTAASGISPAPSQCIDYSPAWSKLSATEQKRQTAIKELISTEEIYMMDMKIVMKVFQRPMAESGVMERQDIESIFVNWRELIACNNNLLRALRIRVKMSTDAVIQMIGDVLVDCFPHMSPYIRFCSRQLNAAALIQHLHENSVDFRQLLKKCQTHSDVKEMPLTSYLLKPMQRITKYPLLIKKILSSTENDHPDHRHLEEALAKAEELCAQINEGVGQQENSERLEWLQRRVEINGLDEQLVFNSITNMVGPRKLLHFGPLRKAKSGKELLVFVFNDFILLTTVSKPLSSLNMQFLFDKKSNLALRVYKKPMFFNEVIVSTEADAEGSSSPVFSIKNKDCKLMFITAVSTERSLWLRQLEEARKKCLLTERAVLQRQRSKSKEGDVCGRLLVLVVEAVNLIDRSTTVRQRAPKGILRLLVLEGVALAARDIKGKSDPYCEVSMGSQLHRTSVIANTLNPKWNASMQFAIKDLQQDVLCITVLDRDFFSPNEYLGRTELRVSQIITETKGSRGPLVKRLDLHEVERGQVVLKLDLQLFRYEY